MDRASQALHKGIPHGVRNTYRALADYHNVARSTSMIVHYGQRSKEQKARANSILPPVRESRRELLVANGPIWKPVRIKHIPSLALSVARKRSRTTTEASSMNWARL